MLKAQQKRLRRARRKLRCQQRQLLNMELAGVVAVTLHSVSEALMVPLNGDAAEQVANTLLEVLRERRQRLRREAAVLQAELVQEQATGAAPPALQMDGSAPLTSTSKPPGRPHPRLDRAALIK